MDCVKNKSINIHLISDSSIQTVKNAAISAMSSFPEVSTRKYHWVMVKNQKLLNEVFEKINKKPGIVLYSISNPDLRNSLKDFCKKLKLPCISAIGKIIKEVSSYLGIKADKEILDQNKFDKNYFDKMSAIDYTIRHDDGQNLSSIGEADIILIGPSRTSKTPTAVYLAYNGFRVANVPYVYGQSFTLDIEYFNNILVIGFIINPSRLIEIREARMNLLQIKSLTDYTNIKIVKEECLEIKKICAKKNCPIIDVSARSIEEIAAIIMKYYYEKKSN